VVLAKSRVKSNGTDNTLHDIMKIDESQMVLSRSIESKDLEYLVWNLKSWNQSACA
jgi:hypothetical protein